LLNGKFPSGNARPQWRRRYPPTAAGIQVITVKTQFAFLKILKVLGVALVLRDTSAVANDISPQPNIADTVRQGEW